MVDAARQMLDELMGRNRNLHPSEAVRKVNWDDPDFCQYYLVKFCPHDLFVNTRADLGPCSRIHDDEAKEMYAQARPGARKRQYEDEFLRFCNSMLNDVDRKIAKGKQRLQLMQRDQPMPIQYVSKYQEQLNNINARIKKLLSEAEEAGIRGDVDQAQDLMSLCEQLKEEKEALIAQHDANTISKDISERSDDAISEKINKPDECSEEGKDEGKEKIISPWIQDLGTIQEKQMEVCETCGAFLIVGDAQQRIEDHLMGKQHLGYTKLRKAVEEIHEKRQKERDEEERKRREERNVRPSHGGREERSARDRRDYYEYRAHSRDGDSHNSDRHYSDRHNSDRHHSDKHRHHKSSHHHRRSESRHHSRHVSRSRSRSRY